MKDSYLDWYEHVCMEKPQLLNINLAKNRGESFWDRFISWALNAGRILVILTEGIALIAFLYRFTLDRQLVDLRDHIKQEQAILDLLKNNEATYRSLQNRLSLAKTTIDDANQTTQVFFDMLKLIPSNMEVTTFQMTQDTLRLEGSLGSISSLRDLIDSLKAYPMVSRVSLDKIQTNTSTATVAVTIGVSLKTNAAKNSNPTKQSNSQSNAAL